MQQPLFPHDPGDPPARPPSLRLFEEVGDQDSDWTLSQFFEEFLVPAMHEASAKTLKEYRTSLRYWEQFCGGLTLRHIDQAAADLFPSRLKASFPRMADNTRRKHAACLQSVLDRAGPREHDQDWESLFGYYCRGCRTRYPRYGCCQTADCHGRPLLERKAPLLAKPSLVTCEVEDNFTLPEIAAVLDACRVAQAPRVAGLSPQMWWDSLVDCAYNLAFRIETLLLLRFDWLRRDELGCWLDVPAGAIKGRRHGRAWFVSPAALAAIERVRPRSADQARELIFPWGMSESWLHECRRRILQAADLPQQRRFGFHGLRKAMSTELSKINPAAAKMALGHAARDVTIGHYTNRVVMVEAMLKLPQPPRKSTPLQEPPPDPQLRLF